MVKMQGIYNGNKKCSLTHEEGATLSTDSPRDIGGEASAFSPTDLVGAALASCIVTTMAMFAERRGIDITGTTFEVTKEMAQKPLRKIGKLSVKIKLPASKVPLEMRSTLEKVGHTCPVHQSLHPDVEVPVEFKYV